MFNKTSFFGLVASALVLTSLAGCGSGGNSASVDPSTLGGDTGVVTTPSTGTNPYGTTPTTGTNPYGSTTPAAVTYQDLTATVTMKKNGSFLGLGTYKCTVEISNPNSVARTGTLTVTFKNGSKTSKTAPTVQQVSLGANETKSMDFSDKKWSTNGVEATITSDPVQGAAAATAASPYGAAPATTGY